LKYFGATRNIVFCGFSTEGFGVCAVFKLEIQSKSSKIKGKNVTSR
jgi:hypothetical protein